MMLLGHVVPDSRVKTPGNPIFFEVENLAVEIMEFFVFSFGGFFGNGWGI